jgi:hypothetical protein
MVRGGSKMGGGLLWGRPNAGIRRPTHVGWRIQTEAFPCLKNIQTLYRVRFEHSHHLYQLGQLYILNKIHDINSGTEFNLNLL